MALFLVGENINKARGHYLAESGKLLQLMRGIYVDADDDVDATVLRHAVRIAHYLYPQAYLSGASAMLLGPTRDGRLFLSGRRVQRTRIRALEIIQNKAPETPSTARAVVDDGTGEFTVTVSGLRQRMLEAFRVRSEHAASIGDDLREAVRDRLIEEYGGPRGAADAVWELARENGWYREGEQAERYLLRNLAVPITRNAAALNLIVAWHGSPVGTLSHDGFEWRWNSLADDGPPLVRETTPGQLPPFIESLLPEGWLETVLGNKDQRAQLRSGTRYMSNVTIAPTLEELASLPADILDVRLADNSAEGLFTGTYQGPGKDALHHTFEANLAKLYARSDTPRLSGVQIKAPMFLHEDGALVPAAGRPFTHILKPAGTGGYETLPVVEWLALTLGAATGFAAPTASLVDMPDGMAPALLVERFDIRTQAGDARMIALEDFTSVLGVPATAKYDGTIERAARGLRALSTDPGADLLLLLKRTLFAWLTADGDMHLKNLSLHKVATPGSQSFESVRLSPIYDTVTTRVFPGLAHDRMALRLNGKDDRLRRADFKTLATTIGVKASDADTALDELKHTLSEAIDAITLPRIITTSERAAETISSMQELIRARVEQF